MSESKRLRNALWTRSSMPNAVTPISGRAVVDISTVDDLGAVVPLLRTTEIVFDSATLMDSVNEWNTWTIMLKAVTRAAYEQRIVSLNLTRGRRLMIRWGIDTGTRTIWSAGGLHRVLRVLPELTSLTSSTSGVPFKIVAVDLMYDMAVERRVVARRGRVSDIVRDIAAAYDLTPVVEPTGGAPLTLVQSFETDLTFVQTRLVGAAAAGDGLSGYYFYVNGGALHFHTRDYQKQPLVLQYNVNSLCGASNLIAVDDAQDHAVMGGAVTRVVTYDPLSGRTAIITSDPQRYTRFGRRLSAADGTLLMGRHVGPNQVALETTRAQSQYTLARDRYERVSFALTNVVNVGSGTVVVLQTADPADSFNGPYHVELVQLTITGGAAQLAVTAARGEVGGGRADSSIVRGGGSPVLAQPHEAPGLDPQFATGVDTTALGTGAVVPITPGA